MGLKTYIPAGYQYQRFVSYLYRQGYYIFNYLAFRYLPDLSVPVAVCISLSFAAIIFR